MKVKMYDPEDALDEAVFSAEKEGVPYAIIQIANFFWVMPEHKTKSAPTVVVGRRTECTHNSL